MQVLGADFTPGAVVLVNGQAQRTRVVSASSLEALLEARDTTKPGQLLIAVLNRDTGLRTEKDVILKVVSPTLK